MRQVCLSVLAVLSLASAACAQGDVRPASSDAGRYPAVTSYGLPPLGRVVHNANDCPPGRAEALWGAGAMPAGYACSDSANGS
jgi:hypothetical protein